MWHRRETRRQTENTKLNLNIGRYLPTRPRQAPTGRALSSDRIGAQVEEPDRAATVQFRRKREERYRGRKIMRIMTTANWRDTRFLCGLWKFSTLTAFALQKLTSSTRKDRISRAGS